MRILDNFFDKRFLDELTIKLYRTPFYPSNIANRFTYPYGEKGSHKLLGSSLFKRVNSDIIEYGTNKYGFNDTDLTNELINVFGHINNKVNQNLLLLEISLNLQFMGMDGTFHTDGQDGQFAYILMLTDEDINDEGGEFINQTQDETVEFKHGRLIEFNASDSHRGFAFNTPHKCRFSVKFLGTPQ